jgi:hypothetical protein
MLGGIAATSSLLFCFKVLRLGTLVPMNIEVPTKYPLSQDRIVVFEIGLHSKSPMLYRPSLHGN